MGRHSAPGLHLGLAPRAVTDVLERVLSSGLQAGLAVVFLGGLSGLTVAAWTHAGLVAAFAAAAALVSTGLKLLATLSLPHDPYLDLLYRVVMTFGQTLAGLMAVAGNGVSLTGFGWSNACGIAAAAATLALLKGFAGLNGPTVGASVLMRPAAATTTVHAPPPEPGELQTATS